MCVLYVRALCMLYSLRAMRAKCTIDDGIYLS